jgi:hypothetical protein
MIARTDVLDLVGDWAAAEQDNDAEALDKLLAGDFVGVGPLGFVLDRDQWLGRFGNGLENRTFAVEDARVRDYGAAPHRPLAAGRRPHRDAAEAHRSTALVTWTPDGRRRPGLLRERL